MNQKPSSHFVAPPEAEDANLPVEPPVVDPTSILEPAPTSTRPPKEIPEWGDNRYYVRHWGINE